MKTRYLVVRLISCLMFGLTMVSSAAAYQAFPDTGQTKCYDSTREIACPQPGEPFYGQDQTYQPRHPRSYTKLGMNGAVLRNTAAYVDNGGPWIMTRDNVTGLIWELKTNANKDDQYKWYDAQDIFIAGLNVANFGGFNDWRMPTIKELVSLVNRGGFNPSIDLAWFPNTAASVYWSSTAYAVDTNYAWVVNYYYSNDYGSNKTNNRRVLAVRKEPSGALGPLVIHGDGTVSDPNTGLMWQEKTASGTYTWQEALAYSEGLNLGGYSDWRLPNINELKTLVNYTRWEPAIDSLLADQTVKTLLSRYWSSTTYASNNSNAWTVSFYDGTGFYSSKADSRYVRAVRGGQDEANAERIFNAAEEFYPNWFYPKGLPVETYKGHKHPMIFRYYQARNIYLITYDGGVYYYYGGVYTPWFTVNEWLTWLDNK